MSNTFSVIVLLYNNSNYIWQCLDSILIQEYQEIEIIVVDDGSKVFPKNEIDQYIRDHQKQNIVSFTVYQNECNFGTVKSANGAIGKSHGAFIKLLAADDALYDQHSLSCAAKALTESPCGIITSNVMRCDKDLVPAGKYRNGLPERLNDLSPFQVFRILCLHNEIVAGGVFFSRTFFEKYGFFDETYRLLEDWPTWLRVTREGCRFAYSPFWGVKYRFNSGVGTSINPYYMQDKRLAFEKIIKPAKKEIGWYWYLKARLAFFLINSPFVRKTYGFFFRGGN